METKPGDAREKNVIRVGVVGCGHWGPNHVRVFSQLRESRVVAAADPSAQRRAAMADQYPQLQLFSDHRQMLAEAALEAVVVAAPTKLHFGIVREALEAGKHVLCEKPLCVDPVEAQQLVDLAATRKLILMVGHIFLFNSGIAKLKECLANPVTGRLRYLRATRTNLGPVRADVNSVYDLATHDIAIFNHLLNGRPESVSAVGGCFLQPTIEDVAFVSLRYPDNILANIQVSWLDPKKLREIVVVGDRQMIVWDELAPAGPIAIYDKGVDRPQDYADFGQFQLLTRDGDVTIPKVKLDEPLKVQNQFFLQAIRLGRLEFNTGDFAIDVVRVLQAIDHSLKQGGASAVVE